MTKGIAETKALFALEGRKGSDPNDLTDYLVDFAKAQGMLPEKKQSPISYYVLQLICDALDPDGNSEMELVLKRRTRGKPSDPIARTNAAWAAVRAVDDLVSAEIKTEAAVAQVSEQTGLSRSSIFAAIGARRRLEASVREHEKCGGRPLWEKPE